MMNGFLNLLKPPGMSSHDAVNVVRKILGERKIGHAGTLDPGAAGVLPLGVGRAAKFLSYLQVADKAYSAEIIFGLATDTGDDTGSPVDDRENFPVPREKDMERVFLSFRGKIKQRPPMYSAVKIKGTPAYKLARQEKKMDLPEREVFVDRLELLGKNREGKGYFFRSEVSKGTYIRSLCEDIGKFLGLPATMGFLLRTRVGSFRIEDAYTIEELERLKGDALIPPEKCLLHIRRYDLPAARITPFKNGLPTTEKDLSLPETVLVFGKDKFLGMGRFDKKKALIFPEKLYDIG